MTGRKKPDRQELPCVRPHAAVALGGDRVATGTARAHSVAGKTVFRPVFLDLDAMRPRLGLKARRSADRYRDDWAVGLPACPQAKWSAQK